MQPEDNYRLLIQYDGRPFCGWQRQSNGLSIQQCIEDACARISEESGAVHGAGRTDAGVHATGQVASVLMRPNPPKRQIKDALNANLPPEIRIVSSKRAPADFHARTHAKQKTYRYLLLSSSNRSPFTPWYAAWIPHALSEEKMQLAAKYLLGEHDFRSFMAGGSSVKTTVRTLTRVEIRRGGGMISFLFAGGGFLRHMVRIIVGTLIEVGRGRVTPGEVKEILTVMDRRQAGPTAPAEGLTLIRVEY